MPALPANYTLPSLSEGEYVTQANIDKIFAATEFSLDSGNSAKFIWKVESVSDDGVTFTNTKRLKIRLTYDVVDEEICGIKITKFQGSKEIESITINKINLLQIHEFLSHLDKIDLKAFSTNRVYVNGNNVDNQDVLRQIETLLSSDEKSELIKSLLDSDSITSEDIVNTGYRRESLEIFRKLLQEDYISEYKNKIMKSPQSKDETAWQHFFQNNPWIFGYGLDYRFHGILQKEYSASNPEASGKEEVKGDFLLGDNKFTTFVEIKRPDTKLFGKAKNRANAWQLSPDLFDAYSQILEQKSSGQIKYAHGDQHNQEGERILQKPYDSKTILIIGNWSEISGCKDLEKQIKERTFELFRRDSRNIEILTFDELYERATFIVNS